jgi:hypothetical protein
MSQHTDIDSFIRTHVEKTNRTNAYTTEYVIDRLRTQQPIVFTKFGDGEYQCMNKWSGHNCDGDAYDPQLGDNLQKAFLQLCDMSYQDGTDRILLGRWHCRSEVEYYSRLYWTYQLSQGIDMPKEIPFVNYHLIYFDNTDRSPLIYNLVQAIQEYPHMKILITNSNNIRLCHFFKVTQYIPIEPKSWSLTQYDTIIATLRKTLSVYPHALILIAGGLASKVLISQLSSEYPLASFLDIGSGFDYIATRTNTRTHRHRYEDEVEYYKNLLPPNWESL